METNKRYPEENPSGNPTGNRGAGDNSEVNPATPLQTGTVEGLGDRSLNAGGGIDPDELNLRIPAPGSGDRQWVDEEDDEL